MRILLDTHTFLWMDAEHGKLPSAVKSAILSPDNEIIVSVVSIWEILIKQGIGKPTTRQPLRTIIEEQQRVNGIEILPVTARHTWALESLPNVHKDPFDRLLIAQSIADDLTFASGYSLISGYPVRLLW